MSGLLNKVLEAAAGEGFLSPGAALAGVDHSEGFLQSGEQGPLISLGAADLAVDLGTGGGLPGIVLASRTRAQWAFIERSERRCRFLEWAVRELNLGIRVEVINGDARELARSAYRGRATLVTARGFGTPAVTAEIGAALLIVGGTLVVSEPPPRDDGASVERWPSVGIGRLGLMDAGGWHSGMFGYRALSATSAAPERFPRGAATMASNPIF